MKSDRPRVPAQVLESLERPEPTHYRNVDLDILSHVPLDGLIDAMGDDVFVLYVGGEHRTYEAHVELAASHVDMTADRTIVGLTRLIQRLPPRHRRTWERARSREFNVGIETGLEPRSFELRLKKSTLEAITDVGGSIVVTVYAPDLPKKMGGLPAFARSASARSRRSLGGGGKAAPTSSKPKARRR